MATQDPTSRPHLSPRADRFVLWTAVALTGLGAIMLLAGMNAGVAFPLVAIGASMLAIEQADTRRGH